MSLIFSLVEFLIFGIITLDTLGFIVAYKKKPQNADHDDYTRVCFTWVFVLAIRTLMCCGSTGFFAGIFSLVALAAKVYVTIPKIGGANKVYTMLFKEAFVQKQIKSIQEKFMPKAASS